MVDMATILREQIYSAVRAFTCATVAEAEAATKVIIRLAGAGLKSGNTPTLDCIDPSKGYVRGNIEVVSWRFNKLKSDLTPDEMRRIAAWVLR